MQDNKSGFTKMINGEANLVVEVWEQLRDHLAVGRRHDIAVGMLRSFVEYGFERSDLEDIVDEDDILSGAFSEVFDEVEEDEDLVEYDD